MKIGLCQYNPIWENIESNKDKIKSLLNTKNEKIDLLIFPELTLTGFTMQPEKFAESLSGNTYNFFSRIAERYDTDVIYGQVMEESEKHYNVLVHLARNGKIIENYCKVHPFSYGSENLHYAEGTKPVMSEINELKIGYGICYDLRFPELFRFYGKKRADIIVIIANWPVSRVRHWYSLLKARAIENQCFVIGVNRTGKDLKLQYSGCSVIFDPMGDEKVCLDFSDSIEKESLFITEIDISEVRKVRDSFPFLQDIRLI